MIKKIYVPTVNDDVHDFDKLFQVADRIAESNLDVTFDFSRCGFLRQNAVAFLGGLARLLQTHGRDVRFDWSTVRDNILTNLEQQGFRGTFSGRGSGWTGNSIPYREDRINEKSELMDYLKDKWLGRGWINVSREARDRIAGQTSEVFTNAFDHADSPIGVVSCGQHFPNTEELKLTVVDFGISIPGNVRRYLGQPNLDAGRTLEWAFERGQSTKQSGFGRGMGLDLLKQFVRLNHGKLEVFSGHGHAVVGAEVEQYRTRATGFSGTLVNITLVCDDKFYCLASERSSQPLF